MKKIFIIIAVMLTMAVFANAQITPPYAETFDGVTAPTMPAGWTVLDVNGDAITWVTASSSPSSAPNSLRISYNSSQALNDWAISPALNLAVGTYSLEFKYRASGSYSEKLAVCLGTSPTVAAMGAPLTDLTFTSSTYLIASVTVNVASPGNYYLGFYGHSDADMYYMCVDDISLASASSPPNAASLVSPTANSTGVGINAILNWTLNGGAPTGVKVYLDTVNPPLAYTEVGTAVTSYDPPGLLNTNQEYWWKVVPWNTYGSATAIAQKFTTSAGMEYPASSATSAADTDIGQVTLAGFANPAVPGASTSNPLATGMYTNYTALGPILVFKGVSYPVTITQITSGTTLYAAYGKAYIDYNQDGAFDLVTELAFDGLVSTSSTTPVLSGNITIPVDATLGQTRMRVILREGGTAATTLPTGTYSWGETEDYTVTILVPTVSDPKAPILTYPAAEQLGLPKLGFNLTWMPDLSDEAGLPELYTVYMYAEDDLENPVSYWETTGTSLNPLTYAGGPDPALAGFEYNERWYWAVGAYIEGYREEVSAQQWFKIEDDPSIIIPHTQSFDAATIPTAWTQTYSGTLTSNRWTVSPTALAGGTANEMMLSWQSAIGISRLIPPPISTNGIGGFNVQFKHFLNDYAAGASLKLQYSHNLTDWFDTDWSLASGGGDATGTVTAHITGLSQPTTYIAWVLDGDHYQIDYWYVDDVSIFAPSAHDIALGTMTGFPGSQGLGVTYNPQIMIHNNGTSTETLNVTLSFPGYSSMQTVSGLTGGNTATASFAPWTPAAVAALDWTVDAPLTGDATPENNSLSGSFSVFEGVWSNEAACPVASYLGSAASYIDGSGNGHIVTNGGNTTSTLMNEVRDYNVNTNTWTTLTTMPVGKRVHTSVIVAGKLYIIGGSDSASAYLNTVDAYDLSAGTWASLSPLPLALAFIKAVSYQDNYIYVAGGVDGASAIASTVYLYNISTNAWTTASPLPVGLFGGAFGINGSTMVYAAGADATVISSTVYVGQIDPSDPSLVTWAASRNAYPGLPTSFNASSADLMALEAVAPISKDDSSSRFPYPAGAMYRFDAATWNNNCIIVAGGSPTADWVPGEPGKAYTYNTATDVWTTLPDLNEAVLGAYLSSVKSAENTWNCIVASGLNSSNVETSTTQKFVLTISGEMDVPELNITKVAGGILLDWYEVYEANSYKVYGSNDLSTDPATWTNLLHTTGSFTYLYTGTEDYKFFVVRASTDMP